MAASPRHCPPGEAPVSPPKLPFPWMAVQPCPVSPPELPFRGWPSSLAQLVHRNALFRGWPSGLAQFVHQNCLSMDDRPALPSLSTGTPFPWMAVRSCLVSPPELLFPWMAVQPCPVCPPKLPFPWMRVGENTKKMSVDASRVDSHSNHIINNTKTNNQ